VIDAGWPGVADQSSTHNCRRGPIQGGRADLCVLEWLATSGFFLRVDDFAAAVQRTTAEGVRFVSEPRAEPYGQVVVFLDVAGNRWDLLGP